MPCAIVALLLLCLSFLCFGLLVRTWSRPYGLCHHPYTKAHIKGFRLSLFCMSMLACLLPCFMLVLASLVLGFTKFDTLSSGCVVTCDAHEVLFRCNHLGCISRCRVTPCVTGGNFSPCFSRSGVDKYSKNCWGFQGYLLELQIFLKIAIVMSSY